MWCCQIHDTEFETLSSYQQHIENEHSGDKLSNRVASILAGPSSRPHRDCPLCPTKFDDVDQMRKHIRDHLLRLAMLALRGVDGDDMASTNPDQSVNSSQLVEHRGRRDSLANDFDEQDFSSWEFPTDSLQLQSPTTEGMDSDPTSEYLDTTVGKSSACMASASIGGEDHPVIREIHRKLVRPDDDSTSFLPENDLREIFAVVTVNDILDCVRSKAGCKHGSFDAERDICCEGRERKRIKIFAILVFIDKPCYIANFVRNNIWDDQLPLRINIHDKIFRGWQASASQYFCQWQYKVLAPVINFTTTEYCKFSLGYRMPFLDVPEYDRWGFYSDTSKIRIHEAHQIWKPPLVSSILRQTDKNHTD